MSETLPQNWIQPLIEGQTRDCIHGSLARKCEICERDKEIFELKQETDLKMATAKQIVDAKTAKIAELTAKLSVFTGYLDADHIVQCNKELRAQNAANEEMINKLDLRVAQAEHRNRELISLLQAIRADRPSVHSDELWFRINKAINDASANSTLAPVQ